MGTGGQIMVTQTDPEFDELWHLENTGQARGTVDADIDASRGWAFSAGSSDVSKAVLDTGFDSNHPEFAGRIIPGYDFVNEDSDPEADHPHGTYVAGIAAANANNDVQVTDVDWNVNIMPVKVLDDRNLGFTSDLARGIRFAADENVNVINMSLGRYSCTSTILESALDYARAKGVILIASAGNDGIGEADSSSPGCYPQTITVGATTSVDTRASFSATGAALDLVAPGSSVPTVKYRDYREEGSTGYSGTSASCPIVAAVATLMVSLPPNITHDQVRNILLQTADDMVGPDDEDTPGRDDFFGWGRLNMANALEAIKEKDPDEGMPGRATCALLACLGTLQEDIGLPQSRNLVM